MNKPSQTSNGFTLIELMVVIAIIVLLTGIIVTNLTSSRAKARDTKRISDLGQIQLALSLLYDRCKVYPIVSAANNGGVDMGSPATGCTVNGTQIHLSTFIATVPTDTDPVTGAAKPYDYVVDSGSNPQDFVLHTQLEVQNLSVLKDSLSNSTKPSFASSLTCYNSSVTTSKDYCLGSK